MCLFFFLLLLRTSIRFTRDYEHIMGIKTDRIIAVIIRAMRRIHDEQVELYRLNFSM